MTAARPSGDNFHRDFKSYVSLSTTLPVPGSFVGNLSTQFKAAIFNHDDDYIGCVHLSSIRGRAAAAYGHLPSDIVAKNLALEVFQPLLDDSGSFDTAIGAALGGNLESERHNYLVVHFIEIAQPFRRKWIGEETLYTLFQHFSDAVDFCIIRIYPRQFGSAFKFIGTPEPMHYEEFKLDIDAAKKKLASHFRLIGFRAIPDTDYMVFDLRNTAWPLRYKIPKDSPGRLAATKGVSQPYLGLP